jgi:threonine/homoserine/homoserine lactone efflux protein
MINYTAQFLTVCGLHLLAVASPGPDFAIVVKQSINHGRKIALWTTLGIGSAICVHATYTLLGFGLLVKTSWLVFTIMKGIAAAYLAYLGLHALSPRKKKTQANEAGVQPSEQREDDALREAASGRGEVTARHAFALGFTTNALNPKATLFFVTVISVVVDPATPRLILIGYFAWMGLIVTLWFALVATFFTRARVRNTFLRLGPWFDRAIGVVLLGVCVALALTSFHGK